ncbi:MAG: hypothetical protein MUC40_00975, partial [Akkermansiaceae bacterium]|nr:hypothetical protein [Akkermansiaceae bacterium]
MQQQHSRLWVFPAEHEGAVPVRLHRRGIRQAAMLVAVDRIRVRWSGFPIDLLFEFREQALLEFEVSGEVLDVGAAGEFLIQVHLVPDAQVGTFLQRDDGDHQQRDENSEQAIADGPTTHRERVIGDFAHDSASAR